MLNSMEFAKELTKITGFFAGVPDSTLKHLCTALEEILPKENFWTSANEGNAVALAAGYTFATGLPGVVYMQNSGIGNGINPLLSLNDPIVYGIPALLIVGWRGEPGVKDEPQHLKQGAVTTDLLDACQIPYKVLPDNLPEAIDCLNWANNTMELSSAPVALLIRNGLFSEIEVLRKNRYDYVREDAIADIISCLTGNECFISTTGMISRELYDLRVQKGESSKDLLLVGSMGHVSQVALGIALCKPGNKIVCLDGDGSVLMHMGAMVTIGQAKVPNMIHIMLNNAAHDSVGGHKTDAENVEWVNLALSCGYELAESVSAACELKNALSLFNKKGKCCFLEVKVAQGARTSLGRPTKTPAQMKTEFMQALIV